MVNYINFKEEDCEEAIEFWKRTKGVHRHDNGEDSLEGIQKYIKRNSDFSFIARDNGKLIGAIMCGHDGRRGLIHHLAVDSNYRRQGIGKHLLTLAEDKLKEDGITKCALFVLKDNIEGEKFYQKMNWQIEDIVNIYAKILD